MSPNNSLVALAGTHALQNAALAINTNVQFIGVLGLENVKNAIMVQIKDRDFDGHYRHYCKIILWPTLNYMIPDHAKSKAFGERSYNFYANVNTAFANILAANYKPGDVVWVQDYHLFLVPGMLRKKIPNAKVGFFLHTAFPSSEVFRTLPSRNELLEGVLGANLIGFQTPEYSEHFLETCKATFESKVQIQGNTMKFNDRLVEVTSVPMGINFSRLKSFALEPEIKRAGQELLDKYRHKKLIVGYDLIERICGVKHKLLAYETFLNDHEEYRENVVFFEVAGSSPSFDADLETEVHKIAQRINERFATLTHQPLVFLKQDMAYPQYLGMLKVADVLMVSSLREGLNLTCHDFTICQDEALGGISTPNSPRSASAPSGDANTAAAARPSPPKQYGPIILSEFAGAASVFGKGVVIVNPWDVKQLCRAMKKCLEMSPTEKAGRHKWNMQKVDKYDAVNWFQQLQEGMEKATGAKKYLAEDMTTLKLH
ncbi:MAG: hypothetical protein M1831_004835 [Alyxoria varia]|nr:MAG: hypothetical protein M1831_004835 [Alyxoria varia]